ncbi:hypothetical protein LHFGNBLO_005582 [Mesorhizobium sp. AR10]|uniref:hypothetical protein n=1 Tax=Mesorhizobium sp. AR10 TaxID=2865839 RepID=UPI00215E4859|nr:hypothetical protein [Mesorhizobium sp. AR10]UVK38421.1 hypothetical protein LHFGNBLO_005582 [Mesorhizobium sp. AR10]
MVKFLYDTAVAVLRFLLDSRVGRIGSSGKTFADIGSRGTCRQRFSQDGENGATPFLPLAVEGASLCDQGHRHRAECPHAYRKEERHDI